MRPLTSPAGQRGSIAVSTAFAVLIGLVVLLSVQIGYLFYMKRELQKAADLSALSAVQVLAPTGALADCLSASSPVQAAAKASAVANVPGFVDPVTANDVTVECKYWDPTRADPTGKHLFEPTDGLVNAVQVNIDKTLSALVPGVVSGWAGGARANVTAVASLTAPAASFSVGSRLLSVSDGLLGALLKTVGVDISAVKVLDSNGLATLRVTPAGLLQALGISPSVIADIGTPEQLVAIGQVNLSDLLNASLTAVQRSADTANVQLGLFANAIDALVDVPALDIPVKLFGDGGILALANIGDIQSALHADIGVAEFVKTALMVSNGTNLVDLNLTLLGGLGAADGKLTGVRVKIVEPPTMAWGGEGTVARNTGVKVYLDLKIPLVGGLLDLLGIPLLNQTIVLETSRSHATLEKLCRPPLLASQASFGVSWSLTRVCRQTAPGVDTCGVSPMTGTRHDILLTEPPSPDFTQVVQANDVGVATLVNDIVNLLLDSLGPVLGGLGKLLLGPILALLNPLLQGIVEPLLQAVLQLLGLNLGETDLSLLSVDCGKPRLVY